MRSFESKPENPPEKTAASGLNALMGRFRTRKNVWSIVLTYALVSGLWIFFSDRLVDAFIPPRMVLEWSISKGLLFVVVTAAMLYVLIARLTEKLWRASSLWAASERKFRTLFEEVTDGIMVSEIGSKRIYLTNTALFQMLGYTGEELRGLTILDIHPAGALPRVIEAYERQRHGLATVNLDVPVLRKDGSIFYADINATGMEMDHIQYVIGVFRDVTERKRVESDLKNAKEAAETANRAKDQFIAVLSHELRTPLTPALATIAALEGLAELSAGVRADLDVVRRNLELESLLIDDLLDVTRISRGKMDLRFERTDLHDCLRRTLEICREELEAKHLEVISGLTARNSYVLGDSARLQQVFWNLLKNAIKFTPAGGQIRLESSDGGAVIRVEIADTGIGIEPEALARIFHPFEQEEQTPNRRFGGLGLGLSIARDLVALHHGTLTADSLGKDRGATFVVELPALEPDVEPSSAVSPASGPTRRILLVEDHADTLRILSRLLRKWNYEVEQADSVQSALDLAARQKFDLLISDLGLPDGSGREIMERVKALYGLRGIALSGYSAESDFRTSREAGFEEHLVKPVSFPALQTALERIFGEVA